MDNECINFASDLAEYQYDMFRTVSSITYEKSYAYSPIVLTMALASLLFDPTNKTLNQYKFVKEIRTDIIKKCSKKIVDSFTFDDGQHYIKYWYSKEPKYYKKSDQFYPSHNTFIKTTGDDFLLRYYEKKDFLIKPKKMTLYYIRIEFEVDWLEQFYTEFDANAKRMDTDEIKDIDKRPFMYINDSISSIKMNNVEIISLPFNVPINNTYNKNLNVTMYIILPDENINLHDFLQNLSYSNFLKMINAVNKQPAQKIKLIIPKPYFDIKVEDNYFKELKKTYNMPTFRHLIMSISHYDNVSNLLTNAYEMIQFKVPDEDVLTKELYYDKSLFENENQALKCHKCAFFIMDGRNMILSNGVISDDFFTKERLF